MRNYASLFQGTPLEERYSGGDLPIIAGYCTVPDRERTIRMSRSLLRLPNVVCVRGGACKPRTHPDSFRGYGIKGLEWLKMAHEITGLPIVTEIMDSGDLKTFEKVFGPNMSKYVILQIGSRDMQAYGLLKSVGEMRKRYSNLTVLLKRGMCAEPEEVLGSIDYLGDTGLILLCLRGLQKMDYGSTEIARLREEIPHQNPEYRFHCDVDDIEPLKELLKDRDSVIVGFDPSHIAGNHIYVPRVAREAVEHGADFLLIETMLDNDRRDKLKCDAEQAITTSELEKLISELQEIYSSVNR